MSRQFSNHNTNEGLVQMYEAELEYDTGFVSGNTARLKKFTSRTRSAWDKYLYLAFKGSGTWQFDDSNHVDYPIIKTNLVQGQRDYTFTEDETGNLILDIYKVLILSSSTATDYEEIYPIDQQTKGQGNTITSENTTQGAPYEYDKTANGIILDVPPSYNATNGLKLLINREASYFVSTDMTKMPGCPGIHHDYFYLRPAMEEARIKGLASYDRLREAVIDFEGDEKRGIKGSIERYFARRSRDEKNVIRGKKILFI